MNLHRVTPGRYRITECGLTYGHVTRVTGNLGWPVWNVTWADQEVRGLSVLDQARAFVKLNAPAIREHRPITGQERDESPLPFCGEDIDLDSLVHGHDYDMATIYCSRRQGHEGAHRAAGQESGGVAWKLEWE